MSKWNQPICSVCWCAYAFGRDGQWSTPVAIVKPNQEACAFCGHYTWLGVYVRISPQELAMARSWMELALELEQQ